MLGLFSLRAERRFLLLAAAHGAIFLALWLCNRALSAHAVLHFEELPDEILTTLRLTQPHNATTASG